MSESRETFLMHDGLSPRVRGNPRHANGRGRAYHGGSIPACAGEPEGLGLEHLALLPYGLSPRVRGNLIEAY